MSNYRDSKTIFFGILISCDNTVPDDALALIRLNYIDFCTRLN